MRLPPRLVALTPGDLVPDGARALEQRVRASFAAGLRGVLLREAALPDRVFLDLALALRAVLDPGLGGWLGLHDRPHLVAVACADAVHLGGRSLPPAEVRAWLPHDIALGLSTHAGEDVEGWRDADYLFHGPVLPTSKPGARPPVGFEGLARAGRATDRPVWGLGGLRPEHVRDALRAGARGIAVLSGGLARDDAARRVAEYVRAFPAEDGSIRTPGTLGEAR